MIKGYQLVFFQIRLLTVLLKIKRFNSVKLKQVLLILIAFFLANPAKANYYCDELQLGWSFYCDPKIQEPEKELKPAQPAAQSNLISEDPLAVMEKIREEGERLNAQAVLNPTAENIRRLMAHKKAISDQASYFADSYRRVLWASPEFDYNLIRPLTGIGSRTFQDLQKQAQNVSLSRLNEQYGLFFFFRSDCPYCHAYAPIIKRFAEKHGINIIAISIDGRGLKEFPDFRKDNGEADKLQVRAVPSTILFDHQKNQVINIGSGLLAQSELEERIHLLTQREINNGL